MGVKRADKRRVDEMRVEIGMQGSFKKTMVRSKLTWADHVERVGDEKLVKRGVLKMEKRSRGYPKLRYGIALRDLERV